MFNRLIGSIFTLYNRVLNKPSTQPVITEVIITPNPVNTGNTYLIKVKVDEVQ